MSTPKPHSGPAAATENAVQALLLRLKCQSPPHVLRILFLGNVASLWLDVRATARVAQAWYGEMGESAQAGEYAQFHDRPLVA
jgi:hypothetical protein